MTLYALGEERPRIHPDAYIHPEAVLIGEVRLGPGSSVWPGAVIRADNGPIVIGARTSIQDGAVIHTQAVRQTRIGDDCVIGHLVHLEGCVIEDAVLIGSGVCRPRRSDLPLRFPRGGRGGRLPGDGGPVRRHGARGPGPHPAGDA